MRNFTSSRLRISATAAAAFMIHSPRSFEIASRQPRAARLSYARLDDRASRRAGRGAGASRPEASFMKGDRREPMTREELKHRVDEAIERHADEIVGVGEAIRRHPELGF